MDTGTIVWVGLGWWSACTVVHWVSAALGRRPREAAVATSTKLPPLSDFSIVAPMSGARDVTPAYVQTLQELSRAGAEVLICVADPADGAAEPLRELWPNAPVLFGEDDTFNPKMNNARKGFEAAGRPVVTLCDAGIALGTEQLQTAAAPLAEGVGLVLALKAGVGPENFAAELECAYINGHQARFLFAADRLGLAVASGGVTLLSNETLQRIGNWRGFNRWIADDYSVVRSVRELGLVTRLGQFMLHLPVGTRNLTEVWRRQVRWTRTRLRLPVWPLVLWEPAIGWTVSGVAGCVALVAAGCTAADIVVAVLFHTMVWLIGEWWFLSGRGLAFGPRAAAAALLREMLSPLLMASALGGRSIDWRGTDLGGQWRARRDESPGRSG